MMRNGFTLIELLIVVGILGILAAIAMPAYQDAVVRSRVAQAQVDLRTFGQALETYRIDHNRFPRTQSELEFFAVFLFPELTSPVAYLNTFNVRDPFGPVDEFVPRAQEDMLGAEQVVTRNSYTYTPYMSFAELHRNRDFMKEGFSLGSVGPDRQDSYIVDFPFPEHYRLPGDSVYDSIYRPSNGIVSPGDLGYFGGELSVNGLMGG